MIRLIIALSVLFLLLLAIPIAVFLSLFTNMGLKILISIDQLFGTFLYKTEDLTISSYTYKKCHYEHKMCWFMYIIDALANIIAGQKEHCKMSYLHEMQEFREKVENG